ncbi:MAG: phosphoribosylamine--glycine ligase [Bacteroidales bacterium]|jgi:phosphoribosylamine--glycine ligase|nr:phosphoribosylamine--glycine ligase [Bacteroidales bacterium]
MNILLLGSGGREHAMACKIAASERCSRLFVAPGNAGTANLIKTKNINLDPLDFSGIHAFVLSHEIQMVVVGPEAPLVAGITDYFASHPALRNVMVIGPTQKGATLEGSKDFAKEFMSRHLIPTAAYQTFTLDTLKEGTQFLHSLKSPYVLKADGLAAGKGVLIIDNVKTAEKELSNMLKGKFGTASSKVVVEQFLQGVELSVFVLTDGKHYHILPTAKDYKRIGEGDTGLNTGGMGSISPVHFADKPFMQKVEERIVIPTIKGLRDEGINYKGFIFIGLMAVTNDQGELDPYVIEYNVRMGDPETESVFPRIKNDVVDLFEHVWRGNLQQTTLDIDPRAAACVMLVADGYPGNYEKGKEIHGIEQVSNSMVFHAGTKLGDKGQVLTNGGRVLCVTSLAESMPSALLHTYQELEKIKWEGLYFRHDIGQDLLRMMI